MWQSHTFYDRDRIGHRPWICGELEGEQGVLKQLRINWNPNNKLLAPHFIKMLCFSTTALQSRPKQKAKSAIHRFCFFDDFLLSRDLQVYVHLRWIDPISAALIVNFVWGTPPISPCYFEGGWVTFSKLKFKQHLTTSFCWPSHDVTRGVDISLHLEFRSSWTLCNIWVVFRKQVSLYSCNFEDTVNATFRCVTSISIFFVKATSMLQFEQLDIHILCCWQATIELCTLQRQKSFVYDQ